MVGSFGWLDSDWNKRIWNQNLKFAICFLKKLRTAISEYHVFEHQRHAKPGHFANIERLRIQLQFVSLSLYQQLKKTWQNAISVVQTVKPSHETNLDWWPECTGEVLNREEYESRLNLTQLCWTVWCQRRSAEAFKVHINSLRRRYFWSYNISSHIPKSVNRWVIWSAQYREFCAKDIHNVRSGLSCSCLWLKLLITRAGLHWMKDSEAMRWKTLADATFSNNPFFTNVMLSVCKKTAVETGRSRSKYKSRTPP